MKFNFQLKFDSLFEFGSPAYDDRQIGYLLTEGQFRVFLDYYDPFNNKKQQGFESNEKRRRELEQFIKASTLDVTPSTGADLSTDQVGVHPNGVFVDLPEDFLYMVEESATTTEIPDEEISVKPVKHDEYRANIRNPYKKPYSNLLWRMDYSRSVPFYDPSEAATNKRIELITDGTSTLDEYRIRYLMTPADIIVDEVVSTNQRHCMLDSTLHRVIVDEAVKMAAASVNPEEYQIKLSEQQSGEK